MKFIEIPVYRIVPAPITGIGWVAVERWNDVLGRYGHVSTFRSETQAEEFIEHEIEREARGEEIKCPDCEQKSKRGEIEDNGERCPCCGEGMYLEDPSLKVCDSCGRRVDVGELVRFLGEDMLEYEICAACNTAPEKED